MTNEQLCSLVREGDKVAESALIENILPSIRITAAKIKKRHSGIMLEKDDLVQDAMIGVLRAVKTYDADTGNRFLNLCTDNCRKCDDGFSIFSFDAPPPGLDAEANITYADIIPDDYTKNPEQLFIRKETITELRNDLETISDRERTYLHYRFGFLDYEHHDQSETTAHFHLSLSRARSTERTALGNVRRALPG